MPSLHLLPEASLVHLVTAYGALAVFVAVTLESMGLPLPSESMLVTAAVLAGADGNPAAVAPIVLAACCGALLGDNLGYGIGRRVGPPLLAAHGARIGLDGRRQRLARYLFRRYGGRIVFLARFVAVLRTSAGLLAGANRMPWPRFLAFNALGGIVWASLFGWGGYAFGRRLHELPWPVTGLLAGLVLAGLAGSALALRRKEAELQAAADRAFLPEDRVPPASS